MIGYLTGRKDKDWYVYECGPRSNRSVTVTGIEGAAFTVSITDQNGNEREEFVATKIGHDMMWTPYTVDRAPQQEAPQREAPGLDRSQAFERDDRPAQQREPAVMSH